MRLVVKTTETFVSTDGKVFYEREGAEKHEWLLAHAVSLCDILKETARNHKLSSEADEGYEYVPFEALPELIFKARFQIQNALNEPIKEE